MTKLIYETDYLAHHGILDQKWGFRRYQNPDGSLTPEGRKRYAAKQLAKQNKRDAKIAKKLDRQVRKQQREAENKLKQERKIARLSKKNQIKAESYITKSDDEKTKNKVDLTSISTADLEELLKRTRLEKEYLAAVSPPKEKSGQQKVQDTMVTIGSVLAVVSSGVGVYKSLTSNKNNSDGKKK